MAEGDTILRAARRIDEALGGDEVTVSAPSPRGRATGVEQLDGRTLEAVEARGKHLLLRFGELVLHSHLGMSGAWHVYQRGAAWRKPLGAAWAAIRGERAEAVEGSSRESGTSSRTRPASRLARIRGSPSAISRTSD